MCGLFIYTALQSVLSLSVKVAANPSGRQTKLLKAVGYITFFVLVTRTSMFSSPSKLRDKKAVTT